ncbi:MAG TPA: lectin-like protein [Myxococcota bacterium]|nr:lectin-like protein [Myxococcota bacterium]
MRPLLTLLLALSVPACAPQDDGLGELGSAIAGPPGALTLEAPTCIERGVTSRFVVTGAPAGRVVALAAAFGTSGPLWCPGALGGTCTGLSAASARLLTTVRANAAGVATFNLPVPAGADAAASLQAIAIDAAGAVWLSGVEGARLDGDGNVGPGAAGVTYGQVLLNAANGHRYQIVNTNINYAFDRSRDESETQVERCQRGHLVTFSDQAELDFVNAALAGAGGNTWIGLFQDTRVPGFQEPAGGFAWVTGEPVTFTRWNAGEPSNDNNAEHYAQLYPSGLWNDYVNSGNNAVRRFVIEFDDEMPIIEPTFGHAYKIVHGGFTWEEALLAAQTTVFHGVRGHLATLRGTFEQTFFEEHVFDGQDVWIGGYQDRGSRAFAEPSGGWRWVNQEPFFETAWGPGEPNDNPSPEDFIEAPAGYAGEWNDAGDHPQSYLIEFDPFDLTPTTTATAWMPFEGRYDDVSDDHHGTVSGASAFVFGSPPASLGASSLDMTSGRVVLSHPEDFPMSQSDAFTLGIWIRPDQIGRSQARQAIVAKGPDPATLSPSVHYPSLELFDGRLALDCYYVDAILGSTSLTEGEWTHVAVTNDGSGNYKLYVNGLLDGQGSFPAGSCGYEGVAGEGPWVMRVGFTSGAFPHQPLDGGYDDFVFFSRELDAVGVNVLATVGPKAL